MGRVVAFIPDLMFGSRVRADLLAGGHTVELVGDAEALRETVRGANVLIVDLTDEASTRTGLVQALSADGSLNGVRTLAFYSHVEVDTRDLAHSAGFDLVVPRSRMAREGALLATRLAASR
jgi:hypothetical protein